MSHTPGPWRFEESDDCGMPEHGEKCRYIRATVEPGALMGGTKYYPWTPENRDDWTLIAAAPDLLAALYGLVELSSFTEALYALAAHDPEEAQRKQRMSNALTAIAKAEGR